MKKEDVWTKTEEILNFIDSASAMIRKWEKSVKMSGSHDRYESVYKNLDQIAAKKEHDHTKAKQLYIDGEIDRDQYAVYHSKTCSQDRNNCNVFAFKYVDFCLTDRCFDFDLIQR